MPSAKKKSVDEDLYKDIANKLKTITKEPEKFLKAQPEKCNAIRDLVRDTYKQSTLRDLTNLKCPHILQDLIVDEMDEEQIWQQLELRNDYVLKQFIDGSAKLLALREQKLEIRLDESDDDEDDELGTESDEDSDMDDDDEELKAAEDQEEDAANEDDDDDEDDDDELEEERNFGLESQKPKKKFRSSIVDDKFFKLGEMEAFLEVEDAKEMSKQKGKQQIDDGIDYFADDLGGEIDDDDEDEEDDNPNYSEFFMDEDDMEGEPKKNKLTKKKEKKQKDHFSGDGEDDEEDDEDDDEEDEDEDEKDFNENNASKDNTDRRALEPASDSDENDGDEEKPKSSFEQRELRLQQRIHQYEDEVLGEKPWQLKGEIQAGNRPQNSLLEEILEFESTVRPAPIITEETTRCLEDIIKQRIKDKAWDDVERIVKPTHTAQDYRKQLVLDQEKSKESLAQIYEKEYQKELDKLDPSRLDDTADEETKEHKEIKVMLKELFNSLDALFNYNFTPNTVMPEPKIITNTPAVSMEEVAPVAVSDAALLAPEEVYRGPKHELVGKTERNRTDKNRERRKKKQKQRAINKVTEERDLQRQKLGIPLTKKQESAKLMKSITKHRNVQKITASNDQGSLKSSKAFFSKLQDTTTNAGKQKAKDTKKKNDGKTVSAKKLKL